MAKHSENKHKQTTNEPNFGDWVNNNGLIIGFLICAAFILVFGLQFIGDIIGQITQWFSSAKDAVVVAFTLIPEF